MENEIRGSCLCGGVRFVITGTPGPIGQCHCSKCRKGSGTDGNAVMYAATGHFAWESGEDLIKAFYPDKQSDWHSVFCQACGSPVPLESKRNNLFYVPAGLLDDDPGHRGYVGHIFVESKAPWVKITDGAPQFAENIDSPRLS